MSEAFTKLQNLNPRYMQGSPNPFKYLVTLRPTKIKLIPNHKSLITYETDIFCDSNQK